MKIRRKINGAIMFSLIAALVLGFQHAFEFDHLAGLTSFANSSPHSTLRSALKWVAGHTTIIFLAAIAVFLFAPKAPLSTSSLDVVVGIVLIALAANKLRHSFASSTSTTSATFHAGKLGLLHGLSGTGAFVALAFAAASSAMDLVLFSALFGIGLALGAVVAALLLFAPFSAPLRSRARELNIGYAIFTALVGVTLLV